MHEIIHEAADRYKVTLVDVRRLTEQRTTDGITGNEWLLDQVHPNITGHRLIADALYGVMENNGMVQTPAGWRTRRNQLCEQHLASLDDAYYARGEARLKRLAEWSRGRIPKK
jgi:hypothetical protein